MHITYSSSLSDICAVNSSFDSAVLKVAYTGKNRNGSFISKEAYEKCIGTIYNCPVVCNYNRENDSIGGHDMELVVDGNGTPSMVNVTQPVGTIPESANYWWEIVEEEDGTENEYLCVDVLLWKRQEAYKKIKNDGITSESMELTVKEGSRDKSSGLYIIDDFEFTAFCLLGDGIEPCFESASLETFALNEFKEQMNDMMSDLREALISFNSHKENNEIDIENEKERINAKGGNEKLEEKLALVKEYGLTIDDLDFAINDMTDEELKMRLDEMKFGTDDQNENEGDQNDQQNNNNNQDPPPASQDDGDGAPLKKNDYSLNSHISEAIYAAMSGCEMVETEWGTEPRYWLVDFDMDAHEIYVQDVTDWNMYGFEYEMNGDSVVIKWECKKRKKCSIVDYDEGNNSYNVSNAFSHFEENYKGRINDLNKFKLDVEEKENSAKRDEVMSKFEDLEGNESFELLKENASKYDVDTLEEKCFAIRGRIGGKMNFSMEQKSTKIPVAPVIENENEPYGGLFKKYGSAVKE